MDEAAIAGSESIDILDFKEPSAGSLAPVDPVMWRTAAEFFQPEDPILLSAALGEGSQATEIASQLPSRFRFAKAGPSECRDVTSLVQMWQSVAAALSKQTELVAVAYADHESANCLSIEHIIDAAASHGLRRLLIDTFIKNGQSSLDHVALDRWDRISRLTEQRGLRWMLAGAICCEDLQQYAELGVTPSGYGVRGDICDCGREGSISVQRLRRWRTTLNAMPQLVIPNLSR
jgi:hypothetical protein